MSVPGYLLQHPRFPSVRGQLFLPRLQEEYKRTVPNSIQPSLFLSNCVVDAEIWETVCRLSSELDEHHRP
jgi:hypothetical protein